MKKQFITRVFLSSLVLALTSLFGGGNLLAQTTDKLTAAMLKATSTTYADFSGVKATSDAVYAGNSGKSQKTGSIQLRSNKSNSGIVTTASGGKVTQIVVEWSSNSDESGAGKSIDVYGKSTAYSGATDLYGSSSTQGTKIGSIAYPETTLDVTGDYEYIGLRSRSGALYLPSVEITWEALGDTRENPGISFSATSCDVQIGNLPYEFPEFKNPNSLTGIKYASSEPTIATIDANSGEITLTGEVGQTTISAEFSGNTGYKGGKVEYTLNVSKASAYIYKKVTATDDIMDGGQYIIVCEGMNYAKNTAEGLVGVTITDGVIPPLGSANYGVYTFEVCEDGGFYLKSADNNYLSAANSTGLSHSKKAAIWTVTIDESGNVFMRCSNNTDNDRQILLYDSGETIYFRNYKSSSIIDEIAGYYNVQLYQKVYPLTVAPATGGYATFYNDEEAYQMPEGLTGYAVTTAENGHFITRKTAYEVGATVPAKTPLLIIGQANSYYPAVVSGDGVTTTYEGSNLLEGARDANGKTQSAKENVYYYKLGFNAEKQLGFYWGAKGGAAFQMQKATTAYLAVPQTMANGANALFFDFGPETGINEIQTEQADKAIFDLSGRRVQKATKGFYIVGGKKVLVK